MGETKERREQLLQASESLVAAAEEIESIGEQIQSLMKSACEIDGEIKTLTSRLATVGVSEGMAVCVELSTAVRTRAAISSRAQDLNLRASQCGNKVRDLALRHVNPRRLLDTIGSKLFHNAA